MTPAARTEKKLESLSVSFLLVSIDALQPAHLGCYGYPGNTSPNIDYWSKRSIVQANTFTQSISTKSALMTLLTSLHPSLHRINDDRVEHKKMSPRIYPLQEILGQMQFKTAACVDGRELPAEGVFRRGFELYEPMGPFSEDGDASVIKNRILPLFEGIFSSNNNLFCLLHSDLLNFPCIPPQPWLSIFVTRQHRSVVKKLEAIPDYARLSRAQKEDSFWQTLAQVKNYNKSLLVELYDGQIRYLDASLGLLLSGLPRQQCHEDLLFVLTSPHGTHLVSPDQRDDTHLLHDTMTHVPLILRLPDNTMGGLIKDTMAELTDVLPTVLELLGAKPLNRIQGQALFQTAQQQKRDGYAYSEATFVQIKQSSIRTQQWKYIKDKLTNTEQLYHLVTDPAESGNLASQERYQTVKQQFQAMLETQSEDSRALEESLFLKKKLDIPLKDQGVSGNFRNIKAGR